MSFRAALVGWSCLGFGLVACGAGDTATSSDDLVVAKGVDYAWARPSPSGLRGDGYTFAVRYLSHDTSKDISAGEAASLWSAGVDIVSNWESTATSVLGGYAQGVADAQTAEAEASAAGMPANRPIYFSIDFDAQASQQATINAYYDGVASVIGRSRTGAYAGYYELGRLFNDGKIKWGWQTYAWSYGNWDSRAQLRQVQNDITAAGDGNCCDRDEAVTPDFGQWHHGGGGGGATGATHFASQGHWLTGFGGPDWAGVGDFNGDGKLDIAWYEAWNDHGITVALSNGHGFDYGGKWLTGFGAPDWAAVGDFDGDGKADIAWYEAWNQNGITVARSTGSSFQNAGHWITGWGKPDWAGVGDFDGDGKADIAWYEAWNNAGITVGRSTGGSFQWSGQWLTGWGRPDWAGVGDFDGDGKADVAWYEAWNNHGITVGRSTGSAIAWSGQWLKGWGAPDWAAVGDFDGDGKADIAWYEAWNNHGITVGRSTGSSLAWDGQWITGWGAPDRAFAGDFDGDGQADVGWYEAWNDHGITIGLAR